MIPLHEKNQFTLYSKLSLQLLLIHLVAEWAKNEKLCRRQLAKSSLILTGLKGYQSPNASAQDNRDRNIMKRIDHKAKQNSPFSPTVKQ
jgi:hypothetical protein